MSDPIDRRSVLRHVGVVGAGAVAITVAGGVTACSSTSSPTLEVSRGSTSLPSANVGRPFMIFVHVVPASTDL